MTTNYGKLLITIEGKDCTYTFCNGQGICEVDRDYPCPECKQGKSPTKLIFDAKGFKKCDSIYHSSLNEQGLNKECPDCKGTGYLLPQKEEYIYLCKWHGLYSCCEDCKHNPFRLTSDAVLKSVGEMPEHFNSKLKLLNAPDKKIVIAEGYYE